MRKLQICMWFSKLEIWYETMVICKVELAFERIAEAPVTCLAFASPAPITSVPSVAKTLPRRPAQLGVLLGVSDR